MHKTLALLNPVNLASSFEACDMLDFGATEPSMLEETGSNTVIRKIMKSLPGCRRRGNPRHPILVHACDSFRGLQVSFPQVARVDSVSRLRLPTPFLLSQART